VRVWCQVRRGAPAPIGLQAVGARLDYGPPTSLCHSNVKSNVPVAATRIGPAAVITTPAR